MTTAFSSTTQAELEKVMGQEIDVLRAILANLKGEQQALFDRNDNLVYALLEERLDQLERFEQLSAQLGCLTGSNGDPVSAIEQLDTLFDPESLDLCILRSQMASLLDAIRSQSSATHLFLEKYGSTLEGYFTWTATHTHLQTPRTPKKAPIALALLDPDSE